MSSTAKSICSLENDPLLKKCLHYSTTNVCADGMLSIVYDSGAQREEVQNILTRGGDTLYVHTR